MNEFSALAPDDLHFLRIFVQSEGRIRDMEAALGLSYPTIRTRLTALRAKLGEASARRPVGPEADTDSGKPQAAPFAEGQGAASPSAPNSSVQEILSQLEAGALSYEEALRRIKRLNSPPQPGERP